MTILVRPARPQDAEAVAALGRVSFTWAFGHLYREEVLERYLAATYAVAKIAASLAKPANAYFVAEQDGLPLGFLKLKVDCPRVPGLAGQWQTQKLYVDPALVQGGVGKALMAAGEAFMAARGATSSWLVVYEGNARALQFYRALGYREAGAQTLDFEGTTVAFKVLEKALG